MAFGHDFVIDEYVAVVDASKHVLLRAIEGIAHEELSVGGSTDHLDLEEGDSRVLALGQGDPSLSILCGIHERWGVFLIERVH